MNSSVNQIVTRIDSTVRITAITPILFDASSVCFRYFHAYQNPNGGKNRLTEYITICLYSVTDNGFSFNCLPQLEQKKDAAGTVEWQKGQFFSEVVSISIYPFYQKTAHRHNRDGFLRIASFDYSSDK